MKIEFQRGTNIHGPWWSTSVTELEPIPAGLVDLELHEIQYSHLSEETRKNYLKGDLNQSVLRRMEMVGSNRFWLTASREAVDMAIKEAIKFKMADESWEVEL